MTSGFYSLCYHYIRKDYDDPLPRLYGTKISDFNEHIDMIKRKYNFISLDNVRRFYSGESEFMDIKNGVLMTFDDGLSDQFEAAKILAEKNISAVFFVPTCTIEDNLPASPIIIHYAIAIHGIKQFLQKLKQLIEQKYEMLESYFVKIFLNDKIELTIDMIKSVFHYELKPHISRQFLIDVFRLMIQNEDISTQDMHFSKNQIKELLKMGHSIGTHSHSHISLAREGIDDDYIKKELVEPKTYLENSFGIGISSMSYPFGESKDCFKSQELFKRTKSYQLAFTIEHRLNTISTSPLEIGRYMVNSKDNADVLNKKMKL